MSLKAAETEPALFDAEAYRMKHGIKAYLRYVSNIQSEQRAWATVSYAPATKAFERVEF